MLGISVVFSAFSIGVMIILLQVADASSTLEDVKKNIVIDAMVTARQAMASGLSDAYTGNVDLTGMLPDHLDPAADQGWVLGYSNAGVHYIYSTDLEPGLARALSVRLEGTIYAGISYKRGSNTLMSPVGDSCVEDLSACSYSIDNTIPGDALVLVDGNL
ncbi:hypothetical protein NPJ88_000275 [Halomonas elongata]|uniref:hypothetical protein n=1 Tax=Halomonas elongata TaxID=2746 RepID=UPI00255B09EF|nr:hypothetical protein [Halomonas elongata]MDL4860758.1 hypothetical protein [Halomonas elongata]